MDWGAIARYLGAGIAVGFGGMGAGIGEGLCAQEANAAIARQPKVSEQIVRTMLVAQAVAETPGIFALLVAFMLVFGETAGEGLVRLAIPLGAGIAMGLGGLGPGVGAGIAGAKACEGIGRQPHLSGLLTRTMLIGQAISQSTAVYSLVIALLLIFVIGQ
ncbi:MAG: ATP synthase F0 subunit C [Candidatus Latescibacteria bacterium]|jgi:ATP synthase F0 subunit c|nr:ATP synthase F0 subunit C [Candidatus Latescibacterota bacterium]MCK5526653.1 ATP synthase F0 subunit C [Candidatus Latescibacterota bacterium]MCK5734427.1 ATP synthase F0 subunit C [Candidatus Latescibacterota bacterium]